MTDLTDAGLRERLIQEFFETLQAEAVVLVRQKALSRDDCSALVSSFARLAADKAIALRDAARAEQREALEIYGSHLTGCLANEAIARHLFGNDRVDYGMPNGVGTYRDEHPDCTCGFSAAIRARKETR